jgi:hypothetical protein
LLYRQVAGFGPFWNLVHVRGCAPIQSLMLVTKGYDTFTKLQSLILI